MATRRIGLNGSRIHKASVALNRKMSFPLLTTTNVWNVKWAHQVRYYIQYRILLILLSSLSTLIPIIWQLCTTQCSVYDQTACLLTSHPVPAHKHNLPTSCTTLTLFNLTDATYGVGQKFHHLTQRKNYGYAKFMKLGTLIHGNGFSKTKLHMEKDN